jgi:3-oxoacyl-[acyl-carrier protein] reductase
VVGTPGEISTFRSLPSRRPVTDEFARRCRSKLEDLRQEEATVLLENKNAVVYGAGGSMGGAAARALASEGARVFLVGRTLAKLEAVASDIASAGRAADVAQVDVHDRQAVEEHADGVISAGGTLDISFNAVGMDAVQNQPTIDMSLDDFMTPIVEAARSHFNTCTAAARRMAGQGSGVIVTLSTTAAREWRHEMGGFNVACAGIEAFSRSLAHQVGRSGVRVICIRPNFTPETQPGEIPVGTLDPLIQDTAIGRLPRLAEVSRTVVLAASDHPGAMTGAVLNLSCGAIID